jgi:hypothetical protein
VREDWPILVASAAIASTGSFGGAGLVRVCRQCACAVSYGGGITRTESCRDMLLALRRESFFVISLLAPTTT